MEGTQAWQTAVSQMQIEMPKSSFDTWMKDTELISVSDGSFQIGVHNAYARDWLDSRMKPTLTSLLSGILDRSVDITFNVIHNNKEKETAEAEPGRNVELYESASLPTNINSRYTFENFVVGPSNRLAHAASLAVSEKPAQTYNPLFLYSGVGLGKTHLLHAIGNQCRQTGLEVLYVSSEEFTNDLITAIRGHTTQAFREKYRRLDVLLIDDIQFIAGKESTQEEFFHTFNTLHGQNKQIVITSDCPPKAMVTLEERLRSRFEWGLAADIQAPDFETRVAILQSKASRDGHHVPPHVLETLAQCFQTNIRELEGALTRVMAFAQLRDMEINEDLVESAVADLMPQPREIEPQHILQAVTEEFDVSKEELLSRSRAHRIALPRQVAMHLLREGTSLSYPEIGELLGGRDHTTVMYGNDKIGELLETDPDMHRRINHVQEALYGPAKAVV
ncbi:MAG: chromosomal replication initiator protein DnaA [Anaerolineales bacterium]